VNTGRISCSAKETGDYFETCSVHWRKRARLRYILKEKIYGTGMIRLPHIADGEGQVCAIVNATRIALFPFVLIKSFIPRSGFTPFPSQNSHFIVLSPIAGDFDSRERSAYLGRTDCLTERFMDKKGTKMHISKRTALRKAEHSREWKLCVSHRLLAKSRRSQR
jgi:hypothetical protein